MGLINKSQSIHPLLQLRKSPVIFSNRMVEDDKLKMLWEAARWAPSSRNQQPWRFIFAKKGIHEAYERIFDALYEGNKEWVVNVPLLLVSCAEVISTYKNKVNKYAFHDTGMAVMNLIVQATDLGLYVHQMGGYDVEKIKTSFKLPSRYEPVAVIAVGYPGNINDFPKKLQERELEKRVRKPIIEFVFENGKWPKEERH